MKLVVALAEVMNAADVTPGLSHAAALDALAAIRAAGYAIVPTEGAEFDSMVERVAIAADREFDAIVRAAGAGTPLVWEEADQEYRDNCISAIRTALRAAIEGRS